MSRLPIAGLRSDTRRRFPDGLRCRHKDSGICGTVVQAWRFHQRDSGTDGRDYVRVRWPGGIETDEPTGDLSPFAS